MDTQLTTVHPVNNFDVPEGYGLFFSSPLVDHLNDVQIFCLPEVHTGAGLDGKILNARLIDKTIEENPEKKILVLVEAIKSLEVVNQKGHEQVYFCKKKLEVKGWDLSESEMLGFSENLMILGTKMGKAKEDWLIAAFPPESASPRTREEGYKILSRVLQAKAALCALEKEFQIACKAEGKTQADFDKRIKDTFQIRNNMMIETLIKVAPFYDVIFVIAGDLHFMPDPTLLDDPAFSGPEFDLKPLHDFLETQKAVILKH